MVWLKSKIKAGDGLKKGRFPFYTSSPVLSKWIDTEQHFDEALVFGTGGMPSIHYVDEPFSTSTDCLVAIAKNEKSFNLKYVYFFIFGNIQLLEEGFRGAGLKHISKKFIQEIEIPLPDIETQSKIVAILDKAKAILDRRKETIAKYDELMAAIFWDMFGSPVKNEKGFENGLLKTLAKVRIGPFGSLLHKEDYVEGGVPLINPTHIIDGKIYIDPKLTVSSIKMFELKNYILKTGDVVLGRRGEMGRSAVITEKENGYLCGTGSIFIRPKENLLAIYLHFLISSNSMKFKLFNLAKGVTMKNLNSKVVENLKIPVPSIALQQKFSEKILKIEKDKVKALTIKDSI